VDTRGRHKKGHAPDAGARQGRKASFPAGSSLAAAAADSERITEDLPAGAQGIPGKALQSYLEARGKLIREDLRRFEAAWTASDNWSLPAVPRQPR
jgi:hypothetical protein